MCALTVSVRLVWYSREDVAIAVASKLWRMRGERLCASLLKRELTRGDTWSWLNAETRRSWKLVRLWLRLRLCDELWCEEVEENRRATWQLGESAS